MIKPISNTPVYLAVISTGRPTAIHEMLKLIGGATWYVGEGEQHLYESASPFIRVKEGGSLCASRNAALRDAWEAGVPCVQVSDDLCSIKCMQAFTDGSVKPVPLMFTNALAHLLKVQRQTGAMLTGVAPTTNPLNFHAERPVSLNTFIVGDLILVKPCELFFDERFTLKEDYDYTLQHLSQYGIVARANALLADFRHRTNPGGAVATRTADLEDQNIRLLRKKWGQLIVPNPKRPHEVLLRWPQLPRSLRAHTATQEEVPHAERL